MLIIHTTVPAGLQMIPPCTPSPAAAVTTVCFVSLNIKPQTEWPTGSYLPLSTVPCSVLNEKTCAWRGNYKAAQQTQFLFFSLQGHQSSQAVTDCRVKGNPHCATPSAGHASPARPPTATLCVSSSLSFSLPRPSRRASRRCPSFPGMLQPWPRSKDATFTFRRAAETRVALQAALTSRKSFKSTRHAPKTSQRC